MAIETVNPATGKLVKKFDEIDEKQINVLIETAHSTFLEWKETTFEFRKKLMLKAAEILRTKKTDYGRTLTLEMGKTLKQAEAEVEKCAWVCEYYADNAEKILSDEIIKTDASESYVRFDPLGVVLAVMPWNFPLWQVFRFAAPALMAGNIGLLKHASNVPMSAIAIEEIFKDAGFPNGAFTTLLIGSSKVEKVINHKYVKAVTLTGSEPAGAKVASAAGKKLKKSVMELGGSDPFIILSDADLQEAVDVGVTARLINNGQSCIAAKRFIMVEDIADEYEQAFVEKMKAVKIGDPMLEDTELGPIAREDLLIELDTQIKNSVKAGAKILTGGERIDMEGYYYPATVISNVQKGMTAYEEELFGPAAIMIRAKDEEDAINIANDTDFGLGASLWTKDITKAKSLARKINSGSVFINGMVKSDPRLPFGGVNISGYGRELSHYGIKEFVNIKTVWIK
ncbi:MAG: NAD-dependent succinate-semialdehyde dehydrogenase [Melioribacteraceae bacterium]|nr:NAD-dependent succinate-semialdehyde dehydrogenase [Melioribacteraceae bacterium]